MRVIFFIHYVNVYMMHLYYNCLVMSINGATSFSIKNYVFFFNEFVSFKFDKNDLN